MPTYNNRPATELYTVQLGGYQIVSSFQSNVKLFNLKKEARRGYKYPTLTQNLVSFPVLAENVCTITLYITSINITKVGNQVIEGYSEQHTRLWRLKLEDAPKKEDKNHLCICNDGIDQHMNAVLPESNIEDMI